MVMLLGLFPVALYDARHEDYTEVSQLVGADHGADKPVPANRTKAAQKRGTNGRQFGAEAGRRFAEGARVTFQNIRAECESIFVHHNQGGNSVRFVRCA